MSDRPAAAASTRRSTAMLATRGTPSGIALLETAARSTTRGRSTATVPTSESTRLSTRSCRTSRQRLAPSAALTATSRSRVLARASSRFATLAQAISSTMPTAPSSISIHDLRAGADEVIVERPHAHRVALVPSPGWPARWRRRPGPSAPAPARRTRPASAARSPEDRRLKLPACESAGSAGTT